MRHTEPTIVGRLEKVIEDLLDAAGAGRPGYDLESTQGRAVEALRALRKACGGDRPCTPLFRIVRDGRQISVSVDRQGVVVLVDGQPTVSVGAFGPGICDLASAQGGLDHALAEIG
jgi:hypothetical protein